MSEEEKDPRTARDALIIELLGDVGRLHDEIKMLPKVINDSISESLELLARAVSEAENTAEKLKSESQTLMEEKAKSEVNRISDELSNAVKTSIDKQVADSLDRSKNDLDQIQSKIKFLSNNIRDKNSTILNYILATSLLGFIFTFWCVLYKLGSI
ncbi:MULTISPECIES: hypothetical protein [Pectobacterium]|uniref:hypothetical protein n=1 Tax=Pectobacterium TaxID=122277 RepID=UPI00068D899B|nr:MULTISPECIES: hypothetical protein [Pectobacterium]PLY35812.1 hypothetical protein F164LOC_18115 [Pectobacterium carotovorum]SHH68632.1 hypothetical protein SAMN05444147_11630 [Pectobacterium carotovorum]